MPGSDAWSAGDVALGEESEAYSLRITSGGALVRQVTTTAPAYVYPAGLQVADFGGLQTAYTISVAQLSATRGPGVWRTANPAI